MKRMASTVMGKDVGAVGAVSAGVAVWARLPFLPLGGATLLGGGGGGGATVWIVVPDAASADVASAGESVVSEVSEAFTGAALTPAGFRIALMLVTRFGKMIMRA